jgi:hypothetical protein
MSTTPAPSRTDPAAVRAVLDVDRGHVVRAVAIAAALAFVIFAIPTFVGADWITTFTSVAIYSVAAAGFGLLYGRVGMISLGQVALLTIGVWVGTRLSYGTGLPFPILLLAAGGVTCLIGVLVGLPALRLSGLYLALITLMFAGAITVVISAIDFPNGGGGFTGRSLTGALTTETPPVRRPSWGESDTAYFRYTVIVCAILFLLALVHVSVKAGPRLGFDPRERAGGARDGREHHALQAVGVRARVVHDRCRRLPPRRPGRRPARDHVPDAGLPDAGRDGADRRDLQPLGRDHRRRLQPAAPVPVPGAVGRERELPAHRLRRRAAPGAADRAGGLIEQFPKDMANLGRLIARKVPVTRQAALGIGSILGPDPRHRLPRHDLAAPRPAGRHPLPDPRRLHSRTERAQDRNL